MPYFQLRPLPEIFTIANLEHALSKIRTCAWAEFRLYLMTLCSSGNHCIITPLTYWRHFCVFIVNLEQISQIALVFPFLTLNK